MAAAGLVFLGVNALRAGQGDVAAGLQGDIAGAHCAGGGDGDVAPGADEDGVAVYAGALLMLGGAVGAFLALAAREDPAAFAGLINAVALGEGDGFQANIALGRYQTGLALA